MPTPYIFSSPSFYFHSFFMPHAVFLWEFLLKLLKHNSFWKNPPVVSHLTQRKALPVTHKTQFNLCIYQSAPPLIFLISSCLLLCPYLYFSNTPYMSLSQGLCLEHSSPKYLQVFFSSLGICSNVTLLVKASLTN